MIYITKNWFSRYGVLKPCHTPKTFRFELMSLYYVFPPSPGRNDTQHEALKSLYANLQQYVWDEVVDVERER